ncbi:MAG: NAD(P)/FAD-dependent oxidoreductase [Ruminococcaceae bacterium]|nr:NAD(P)/FAD-dependent oxidoreductase [Oscillospiraceae bacterium]
MYDVAVIGAGVIGSAIARELMKYKLKVVVLEKANDVSCGASKANSGIVHGGFDPQPNTLKAKLNVEGVEKLFDAAKLLNVPIKRNGSLVCAFSEEETKTVEELYNRGILNGVEGMKILTGDEARAIEKNLSKEVVSALLITNAGIVCPYELTIACMGNAMDNGAELKLKFEVQKIEKEKDLFTIESKEGDKVQSRYVINSAGGASASTAALVGDNSYGIIPRAGEYLLLDKKEGARVSHTIFQVPTKDGKGILVSPTVDGNLLLGPTATVVSSPEDTYTTKEGMDKVIKLASKSVTGIDLRSVITSFCGVRATGVSDDFIIEESKKVKGMINLVGIDSPGLSSTFAIAEYTVDILKGLEELTPNPDFNPEREDPHFFRKMTDSEKDAYIKEHSDYGKIVCRCERVSEGEIKDAMKRNPVPHDLDGVKRRTRSSMGRCQGGFCTPYIMKLLAEDSLESVTKKGKESKMLTGKL